MFPAAREAESSTADNEHGVDTQLFGVDNLRLERSGAEIGFHTKQFTRGPGMMI